MECILTVKLNELEIHNLRLGLIVSTIGEDSKKVREGIQKFFNCSEQTIITGIYKKAYAWWIGGKGIPESTTMTYEEYSMWGRLADFCHFLHFGKLPARKETPPKFNGVEDINFHEVEVVYQIRQIRKSQYTYSDPTIYQRKSFEEVKRYWDEGGFNEGNNGGKEELFEMVRVTYTRIDKEI